MFIDAHLPIFSKNESLVRNIEEEELGAFKNYTSQLWKFATRPNVPPFQCSKSCLGQSSRFSGKPWMAGEPSIMKVRFWARCQKRPDKHFIN